MPSETTYLSDTPHCLWQEPRRLQGKVTLQADAVPTFLNNHPGWLIEKHGSPQWYVERMEHDHWLLLDGEGMPTKVSGTIDEVFSHLRSSQGLEVSFQRETHWHVPSDDEDLEPIHEVDWERGFKDCDCIDLSKLPEAHLDLRSSQPDPPTSMSRQKLGLEADVVLYPGMDMESNCQTYWMHEGDDGIFLLQAGLHACTYDVFDEGNIEGTIPLNLPPEDIQKEALRQGIRIVFRTDKHWVGSAGMQELVNEPAATYRLKFNDDA